MAARIQPQNIGPDAAGQFQDPYKITGPIPADQIGKVRDAYFKHQADTKPGNYDNDGNFAGTDPFDRKADGSYVANPWSMGHNSGSDRFVEIEQADNEPWNRWEKDNSQITGSSAPTTKRVPAWLAQSEYFNNQGLKNFQALGGSLAWLQKGGLDSITAMVNKAYNKMA